MRNLPKEIKLTRHAKQRLEERKNTNNYYNTKNLMRSSCKWYGKNDLIPESSLYLHCLYVCRKSKNKFGYITDGNIEVLYDKNAKVAITVMEVKEKFLPITQFLKAEVLEEIKNESENNNSNDTPNLLNCPTYNIVYREKPKKVMTSRELFGTYISKEPKMSAITQTV